MVTTGLHDSTDYDIRLLIEALRSIKSVWDGKAAILEMKEAKDQWRQMEWFGFYFEYLIRKHLSGVPHFVWPGDRFGNITFDLKGVINWDVKAKAIKSDSHQSPLNDMRAIEQAIRTDGAYGVILGLCDVIYNDENRTFQQWHTQFKGGLSKYEKNRIERTSISRYRKTSAKLLEILFVVVREADLVKLDIFKQGINSNGRPRAPKYMLDLEKVHIFDYFKLVIDSH